MRREDYVDEEVPLVRTSEAANDPGFGIHIDPLESPEKLITLAYSEDPGIARPALRDPRLPVQVMRHISTTQTPEWRFRALWSNPAIPQDVFEILNISPDAFRGSDAAVLPLTHQNCPPSVLRAQSHASDSRVRAAVASNSSLPTDIAEMLVRDDSPSVLVSLARNHVTPHAVLKKLEGSGLRVVQLGLLERDDGWGRRLDVQVVDHNSARLRLATAKRTSQTDILMRLALDEDALVRQAVYQNPASPAAARITVLLAGETLI